MTSGTRWWILSATGPTAPNCRPNGCWAGSSFPRANITAGRSGSARPTSTTAWCRATIGWRIGKSVAIVEVCAEISAGGLSAPGLHDAGPRHGRRQSRQRLPGLAPSRADPRVRPNPRAKAPASCNPCNRTTTGTSTFRIVNSGRHVLLSVLAFWTGPAGSSCIGKSGRR